MNKTKQVDMNRPDSPLFRLNFIGGCIVGLVFAFTVQSVAAQDCPSQKLKRSSQTPIIKDMVNPIPSDSDFELPMPCGGRIVLRHVCIPVKSFLDDFPLKLGCENCRRRDEGYMEARRTAPIAGAFMLGDLPQAWRDQLVELAEKGDGRCTIRDREHPNALYFFIGKYEVSNWQWQTVMNDECPGWDQPFKSDDPRPKTDVSWFEAVDFTRRYTQWLLENAQDLLPKFSDGRYAHIRLPTEAEWEYAARGGHMLTEAELDSQEIFPLRNRPLSDYAVYTQAGAAKPPDKLAWVGTKCPNPLGLHDTAGNASEMLFEPFRFSIGSRLHGAAGGFLIKGGSYRKSRNEIMPGRREEMPFFLETKEFSSNDLGFRVVLSAIVTPRDRSAMLKNDWANLSKRMELFDKPDVSQMNASDIDQSEEFAAMLDQLAKSADDDEKKQIFESMAVFIDKAGNTFEDKEVNAIDALIWRALFIEEYIVKYTLTKAQLGKELEALKTLINQTLPESEVQSVKMNIAKLSEEIMIVEANIDYLANSYVSAVKSGHAYPASAIDRRMNQITMDQNLEGFLQSQLIEKLNIYQKHISQYATEKVSIVPSRIIEDIVSAIRE
jgi:formylglycine-generating enzyme required for sulfatase activity